MAEQENPEAPTTVVAVDPRASRLPKAALDILRDSAQTGAIISFAVFQVTGSGYSDISQSIWGQRVVELDEQAQTVRTEGMDQPCEFWQLHNVRYWRSGGEAITREPWPEAKKKPAGKRTGKRTATAKKAKRATQAKEPQRSTNKAPARAGRQPRNAS